MTTKNKRGAQSRAERTREHVDRAMDKARRTQGAAAPEEDFTSFARRMGFNVIEAPADFDRVMDDDRDFFDRHPGRALRVRRTSSGELEVERAIGAWIAPPNGLIRFTIVHKSASGQLQRQTVDLPAGSACELPEAGARALWERGAPSGSAVDHVSKLAGEHVHPSFRNHPTTPAGNCMCLRLPIAPDGYASETAAAAALEGFAAKTGTPRPTMVSVGDAVYGVWRFTEPMPVAPWVKSAAKLERLAKVYGLRLDSPVTSDPPFDIDSLQPGTFAEGAP